MHNSGPGNSSSSGTAEASAVPAAALPGGSAGLAERATRGPRPLIDCGDLDMRIDRDGTWHYRGTPIGRLALVKLFASVLRREPDGGYWLVTPAERGRIAVEDAPFLAVELTAEGEGRERKLIFRTNLDEIVTAGPDHPLRVETGESGAPRPYLLVRPGLEARLSRPVFYELVELGAEEEAEANAFGVWSGGAFFRLGEIGPEA